MQFTSPTAALDAISAELAPLTDRTIHTGILDSGLTLDCCTDGQPLVRVETSASRHETGPLLLHGLHRGRCKKLILDVVVSYSACFRSFDEEGGPDAVSIEDATEQGRTLIGSWWDAIGLLACSDIADRVRFVSHEDRPPEGGCAGWAIRLEVELQMCDCPTV